MIHRIEIASRETAYDSLGKGIAEELRHFGLAGVESVRSIKVYSIGGVKDESAERIARELLADAVTEAWAVNKPVLAQQDSIPVEISRRTGVMDPSEASVRKGIAHLGDTAEWVRTSSKYLVFGKVTQEEVRQAAEKLLANSVIEEITVGQDAPARPPVAATAKEFKRVEVNFTNMDDAALKELSLKGQLYMSLPEMKAVQDYFRRQGRQPTDIELESFAQTWSEHCVHKTFRGVVKYKGPDGEERIDNLLKTTIARATQELDKDWCLSVFKDNAGVIAFDDKTGVVFKVETHNHPSAIEPYGGAGTGLGGVIRDPLGTGLGAKPVLNTDVFCFAPPDFPTESVPKGALHPRRVMRGVAAGVRDYGNRMGIPTANGAIYFDERYIGNPLVFCGNVGMIPRNLVEKQSHVGQAVLVVGGRTGRDGIHGATFSSVELHEESETVSSGAVQIGNPIEEKKVRDFLLRARDAGLYTCVTDCGAGGLSSAVGEMGAEIGVEVDLDKVPLKYAGLSYTEIWISEAQERMVFSAWPDKLDELFKLADEEGVEMTVIGTYTGDKKLHLRYHNTEVACIEMDFLHDGCPRIEREAVWAEPKTKEPKLAAKKTYTADLKKILASWNVCSKEWVIRQYDHEVQAGSVVRPLVGVKNDGPGDAAVIAPVLGSKRGVVVSCGLNPKYSDIDPYHMAASGIDEAMRNIVAVGGTLDRCAVLDNFCWGNCDKPDRLGGLVRAARACYDLSKAYGVPFISGKDSLNNEYATANGTMAIPGTLLISAISVMENVDKSLTMDAKEAGNQVYAIGRTYNELGGSHFYSLRKKIGRNVPIVRAQDNMKTFSALGLANAQGLVRSLHDCSEGGLAVAAAEMAFAGGLGMELTLASVDKDAAEAGLADATLLFSESNGRFVAEVKEANAAAFEALLAKQGVAFAKLGKVTKAGKFTIANAAGETLVSANISALKQAWQKPLAW